MIPVEAVEAAVRIIHPDWEVTGEAWWKDAVRERLRTALEAAAPYMQGARSAWHDAVAEAYIEGALSAEQANVMWQKNPYKQEAP